MSYKVPTWGHVETRSTVALALEVAVVLCLGGRCYDDGTVADIMSADDSLDKLNAYFNDSNIIPDILAVKWTGKKPVHDSRTIQLSLAPW